MKIAIASGKGGAGKTSLSTNLCALLAESTNVVLADLDVEEPNSAIFFDTDFKKESVFRMIPEWDADRCTSCGRCQEVCNFNAIIKLLDEIVVFPELCHSCHACSILCPDSALPMAPREIGVLSKASLPRLTLLEGRLNIGEEQAVPLIAHVNQVIEGEYGEDSIVIIDSPPGTSCPVIEVTRSADLVLLVTEPNPFGLNDLRIMVDTLKLLGRKMAVVINRAEENNKTIQGFCDAEGIPLIAEIPHSREAAERYARGKLIVHDLVDIRLEFNKIKEYILTVKATTSLERDRIHIG
jgi:MinD superfamily P-loop ATPase